MNNNEFAIQPREAAVPAQSVESVDGYDMIVDLTTAVSSYCSFQPQTDAERVALFNAVSNPSAKLSSMIGKEINLINVYVEVVDITNTETGEVQKAPRIIFFDKSGASYSCVSKGVFGACKKLFSVFGTPEHWANPLPLEVKQLEKGTKRILTFEIIKKPEK